MLNAYNIVFAALLVPAGRLADLLGRRRMFFAGMGLFLAASAACGLAPSAEVLIGARVLQAAGAALLVPTSLGLLLPEFPPERRASATALWGAIGGVAAATGPSLGGLLIEWADWRLVFFVNLALGAAVLVPARRLLRETRDPDRGAVPDALGIALLAGGVGALSLAIVEAPDWGWGSARVLGAFAVAAVAARRRSCGARPSHAHPVLELSLFRVRSFAAACAGRRRLLARLLRRAAGQHPLPDVDLGLLDAGGRVRGHARAADGGAVERARGADDRPLRPARLRRPGRAAVRARVRAVRDRARARRRPTWPSSSRRRC